MSAARAEQSIPDFPMAFWGVATVNGTPVSEGAVVKAYYGDVLAGQATVQAQGIYGYTEAIKQKLLVGKGEGPLVFKIIAPTINDGQETGGTVVVIVPGFVSGETINKNLDFVIAAPVANPPAASAPSQTSSGGGSGGGWSSYVPPIVSPAVSTSTTPSATSTADVVPTSTKIIGLPEQTDKIKMSRIEELLRVTKYGRRSAKAKQLQIELRELGFMPRGWRVTDYYGDYTAAAVKWYLTGHYEPVARALVLLKTPTSTTAPVAGPQKTVTEKTVKTEELPKLGEVSLPRPVAEIISGWFGKVKAAVGQSLSNIKNLLLTK